MRTRNMRTRNMRAEWVPVARVTGQSMSPGLGPGDIVLTRPALRRVRRDDVIVLRRGPGSRYVKRVAAGPGDVVEMEAGRLRVNGRFVDGRPGPVGAAVECWVVPAGHYFVVGDAADVSSDSRTWEQPYVAAGDVLGVVWARLPSSPRRAPRLPSRQVASPRLPSPGGLQRVRLGGA